MKERTKEMSVNSKKFKHWLSSIANDLSPEDTKNITYMCKDGVEGNGMITLMLKVSSENNFFCHHLILTNVQYAFPPLLLTLSMLYRARFLFLQRHI